MKEPDFGFHVKSAFPDPDKIIELQRQELENLRAQLSKQEPASGLEFQRALNRIDDDYVVEALRLLAKRVGLE